MHNDLLIKLLNISYALSYARRGLRFQTLLQVYFVAL